MPLEDLTSILCVSLILVLTMIFWTGYKQAVMSKEQMKDYGVSLARQEKYTVDCEAYVARTDRLLDRQEILLSRAEALIARIEKTIDGRSEG